MSGTSYYNQNREALFPQYHGLDPEVVHRVWTLDHLATAKPGFACDIGAGTGRDANWLEEKGWEVLAVEPGELREPARTKAHPRVSWLDDSLPDLKRLRALDRRFDLILLSAVWMHVSQRNRERAFRILTELLNPSGLLVISLRHGRDEEESRIRGFHSINADELIHHAKARAIELRGRYREPDSSRAHVEWE